MSRVSKRLVDSLVQEEMFKQFWRSISTLHSVDEVASFFSDLLTETEEVMLAKRLAVAILVLKGKHQVEIAETLHVTYTTIGSVASWVKNAKPHTQAVLQRMVQEQEWQVLLDRIDALLDGAPPRYGSDWRRAGRERFVRRQERTARSSLR